MTASGHPADLRRWAARIDAAPSVARRAAGGSVRVATYLPGERIDGLREVDGRLHVHVVMRSGVTAAEVRRDVQAAVAEDWSPDDIHVAIDDIDVVVGDRPAGRRPAAGTIPT